MSNEHTDPDFLAELEKEADFLNARRRSRGNERLDLKEGDAAIARILPYRFDDKGRFYARLCRHWIGGRPYVCTRDTDVVHGGDPDGKCEQCDLLEKLNGDRDKKISYAAYRMFGVTQYLLQSMVYEFHENGGRKLIFKGADLYRSKELWLYKDPFTDLMSIYKSFLRRCESSLSILDPLLGADLYVNKTRRGLRFEREEPMPIAKVDPEGVLAKVLATVHFKPDEPTLGRDLDEILDKIEDICLHGERGGNNRGGRSDSRDSRDSGRNSRDYDDDRRGSDDRRRDEPRGRRDDAKDEPARRSSRDEPSDRSTRREPEGRRDESRTSTDRREPEGRRDESRTSTDRREPEGRRSEPERTVRDEPRRESRRDEEPRGERSSSRDEPRRGRDELQESRREPTDDRGRRDDRHPDLEEALPPARGGRAEAEANDRGGEDPPPPINRSVTGSRREIMPPPAAVTGATRGNSREEPDDEPENLPEDDKDRAPATQPQPGEVETRTITPEVLSSSIKPAAAALSSDLRNSIRNRVQRAGEHATA